MKSTHFRLATAGFLLINMFAANTYAHELVLTVDQIKQLKGNMMIALYNSNDNYKSNTNTFSGKKVAVTEKILTVNFGDIPAGDYAIKLCQDENDNGKIDKNFVGIPTEGYGFSNNGGEMGQPDFGEAKFTVNSDTNINIHLR